MTLYILKPKGDKEDAFKIIVSSKLQQNGKYVQLEGCQHNENEQN